MTIISRKNHTGCFSFGFMKHFPSSSLWTLSLASAVVLALAWVPVWAAGPDLDGDGVPNVVDPDIDNDGIPNALDRNIDGGIPKSGPHKGRHIGDHLDNDNPAEKDIDDDGLADDSLGEADIDGDGKRDDSVLEGDVDGDHRLDDVSVETDMDGDGREDAAAEEDDIDGDGFDDDDHVEADIDGDGRDDEVDEDIDGDHRANADGLEEDTDGDGRVDGDVSEDNDDGDSRSNREDDDDDNDGDFDEDDADHRGEHDEAEVQVDLTAAATVPAGSRSRVKIQRMATGQIELEVEARGLMAGEYEVVVNDRVLGGLRMESKDGETRGRQEFESRPNKADELPLAFDPAGLPILLRREGEVFYSGVVPTTPLPGAEGGTRGMTGGGKVVLVRAAEAPAGAKAKAVVKVQFGVAGLVALEVEVERILAGDYELIVGGVSRGVVTVAGQGGQERGVLRFMAVPKDPADRLLDFAAAGQRMVIRRGETLFFSGVLPEGPL